MPSGGPDPKAFHARARSKTSYILENPGKLESSADARVAWSIVTAHFRLNTGIGKPHDSRNSLACNGLRFCTGDTFWDQARYEEMMAEAEVKPDALEGLLERLK